ncbi:MAG: hypothetical protein ACSLE3_10080, partial [Microbacteriaceae bacterium]
ELDDPAMPTKPLLDFGAGYVQRAVDEIPRQGVHGPWQMTMNYTVDADVLRNGPVADPGLRFGGASAELNAGGHPAQRIEHRQAV